MNLQLQLLLEVMLLQLLAVMLLQLLDVHHILQVQHPGTFSSSLGRHINFAGGGNIIEVPVPIEKTYKMVVSYDMEGHIRVHNSSMHNNRSILLTWTI